VAAFGEAPGVQVNDGVVPLRSQVHGRLVWTGYADHLDVLGHFDGGHDAKKAGDPAAGPAHVDWLRSGAGFDEVRFREMTRAIGDGMRQATG
jgi:hypothetical protein